MIENDASQVKSQPETMKKPSLNPKQRAFCIEYIKDHNATQAAIRAGYSEKTAYSQGQRLLKNVEASRFVAELEKDAVPDAEEIRRSNVKFWKDARNDQELLMRDRLKASELLGDSVCQFVKKVEVSGSLTEFDYSKLTDKQRAALFAANDALNEGTND